MLGHRTREARRTEQYLDGLMTAEERRASEFPSDVEVDPAVRLAARQLRAGLFRVHPSFRFEEALAGRLAAGAIRQRAGLPIDETASPGSTGTVAQFPGRTASGTTAGPTGPIAGHARATWPVDAFRRLPEMAAHPTRPMIVGGVGVASAAISIGAVYVAWRHSRPAAGMMGRAARAAHGHGSRGRAAAGRAAAGRHKPGVINGIAGVLS
jgi:hypothetical protein